MGRYNEAARKSREAAKNFSEQKNLIDNLADEENNLIDHFEPRSSGWATAGKVLCIAGVLLAIGTAAVTIYDTYKYYHVDYAPIPRKLVHESSDDKGRMVYTIYDCVLCNRAKQGFANDTFGDYGDMNGDVGKQWLALYTTKDIAAGDPITTDIISQKGSNKIPLDKTTGIKLFGNTDTVNIVSEDYGYNDSLGGLYIFCGTDNGTAAAAEKPAEAAKTETAPATESKSETESKTEDTTVSEGTVNEAKATNTEAPQKTGSVVGSGTMVMSCGLSAAVGALICFLLTRKKRAA